MAQLGDDHARFTAAPLIALPRSPPSPTPPRYASAGSPVAAEGDGGARGALAATGGSSGGGGGGDGGGGPQGSSESAGGLDGIFAELAPRPAGRQGGGAAARGKG
jgi:hypothetical protein